MYKKFLLALILGLLIGVLAACGDSSKDEEKSDTNESESANEEEATNDDASDKEVYTVATDNGYVPFEFIDEDSGDLVGFDIDLINALAEEAGIEIEFEVLEFDGIVAGVSSGRFDVGIAGMTITEERQESIDFTQPYYEAGLILAVKEGNEEIQSIDDVDGKVVATRTGSTSQEYLEANTEANAEAFPGIIEAYQNVLAGRADAVLYDLPNVSYYSEKEAGGELKTVGEKLTGEDYGIAFPKGSELRDVIDDALTSLKENGTYDDIYEEWFGERPEGT
ncbi:transporter substrate-binding domain-containing protein [Pseudogracilibacillus auburnensis]|uniref:Amino acid ABC transporter substrate-binding protein (PAAT family) n=1 Tax=Pseudogracilibacillus auburnensis TaxID=1494959 RepID=A0A2V3WA10_9BACI|nr:transporter substrate-binding domain-containing protein [Pseudogracilibacillus auburnensis]MBO1005439.1 transporter substrate-binding domain-containing protein [Pseudogracilibacillus auburnensis]PXW90376.1 amino acid ABC transporter substrate-binding protein (PAAT family) [Pseudogracilibacillus auburnensis]